MRAPRLPLTLALSVLASAALAQTPSGNPLTGKQLFENTPAASGKAGITMNCVSCHGSVEDRRIAISASGGGAADPHADISFDQALVRFQQAIGGAMQQFSALDAQQRYDIAAYLADTPKTEPASETTLNFSAALNGNSAAQTVTLRHASTAGENLAVEAVTLEGSGAAQFVLGNALACQGVTLAPGQSCMVSVTFAPTSSGSASAELVLRMSQGTSDDFYRVLPLAATTTGTTPTASEDDSGGGALGRGWLSALAVAVGALSRRRRA